jgi:hypothetical protein
MKEYTVSMALTDFIPVVFFAIAAIILQRDLYNKMSKGAFALFAVGTIDIICAGAAKALYKLLYATNICDFQPLNAMFFPLQSIGFLLAGIGILAMVTHKQTENAALALAAPPVYSGTMIFVAFMVVGLGLVCTALSIVAAKLKKPLLIALFVVVFFLYLSMGCLSTRDFSSSYMNWLAQGVNFIATMLFLFGVMRLHSAGLADLLLKKQV